MFVYRGKVPHLYQVSPGRGSGAQPDEAGTRSWPHDSCTRPPRSHWPQRSPLTGSREGHHKGSRVGIFLGTLPHLTAGILEADRLPCSYSGLWKSADMQRNWSSDDEFKHHRHSFTGVVVRAGLGALLAGTERAAGWSLSVPRSALCSGRLVCVPVSKARSPLPFCSLQQQCAPRIKLSAQQYPHLTPFIKDCCTNKPQVSKS